MHFSIKETKYFKYNKLFEKRKLIKLPGEESFYVYKENHFPLELQPAEKNFYIQPVFLNDEKAFTETWLLFPYKSDSDLRSSFTIISEPLKNFNELKEVLNSYGFDHIGKLSPDIRCQEPKEFLLNYLREQFPNYFRDHKFRFFLDKKKDCIVIESFYITGANIKIFILNDEYWFIPIKTKENAFEIELCKTAVFLLNQIDLINIFGKKQG